MLVVASSIVSMQCYSYAWTLFQRHIAEKGKKKGPGKDRPLDMHCNFYEDTMGSRPWPTIDDTSMLDNLDWNNIFLSQKTVWVV